MYDVIIVGGGPAGLSAALVLGRCRRKVLVCDAGHPRNAASHALHGYLSRDGLPPAELLRLGRAELAQYGVECRDTVVESACRDGDGFAVTLRAGTRLTSKMLLVATGVCDCVPQIDGIAELYGRSVFHCPYCDAWEVRDQPLAAYGRGRQGAGLALSLKTWSEDVVLCTDGPPRLSAADAAALERNDIPVRSAKIARLDGADGILERIVFAKGDPLPRRALFFSTGQVQHSELPVQLGCMFNRKGTVQTNSAEGTHIPGLYVAGDASRDMQFVIVAAAEGARAAVAMNKKLQERDRR